MPKKAAVISPSDPAARFTKAKGDYALFGYSTNYLAGPESAVILDVEATTSIRQTEVAAALDLLDRAPEIFGLYPATFVADGAYGNGGPLGWLVEGLGIEPHIPVSDQTGRKEGGIRGLISPSILNRIIGATLAKRR